MLISDCLDSYDDSSAKIWGTKFGSIAIKILTPVSWRSLGGAGDSTDMTTLYLIYVYIYCIYIYIFIYFHMTVKYRAYTVMYTLVLMLL